MNRLLPVAAALLATALLVWTPAPTPAALADEEPGPLDTGIAALEIGARRSFRLVSVYPLLLPESAPRVEHLQIGTADGALELVDAGSGRRGLGVHNGHADDRLLLLPGRVVRDTEQDYALNAHFLVAAGATAELPLVRASHDGGDRKSRVTGAVLPPTLRWFAITEPRDTEVRETAGEWARALGVDGRRGSPLELVDAPSIVHRSAEYALGLAFVDPRAPGKRLAGWAVYVDDRLALIEATTDAGGAGRTWLATLSGIATEAAYLEFHQDLLFEQTLLAPESEKDQRVALGSSLMSIRDVPVRRTAVTDDSYQLRARTSETALNAIVVDDVLAHFLYLKDPGERGVPGADEIEPGRADRTGPQTGEEERVGERRDRSGRDE